MWKEKEHAGRKFVAVQFSVDADQNRRGVARATSSGESLEEMKDRFALGTTWRFTKIIFFTGENPQYLHTVCNLRLSTAARLLQSTRFPTAPEPVTTIVAVLKLQDSQRFDLMAVPADILVQRRSAAN